MPPGIHAGELHKAARSYIGAARKLEQGRQQFLSPRYFLLCHGLELGLKAFLAANGDRWSMLMGLGHDLNASYKRAQVEYGFQPAEPLLNKVIELMSPEHKKQLFRYPGTVWLELPGSDQCCDVIDGLLDQISGGVDEVRGLTTFRMRLENLAPDPNRIE
ncbi:hypothetical protein AA309_12060 [Microvirga vignae]|uniref:HEPN domain-containing protein n=2 Tax=Microvirga vignae TaxID=1225564 RepID=A0A0H1RCE8_9HYPH|nr:hypothetical protein AA309_12060 [Microvirga vignae]